jgi:hypothetical protein
MFSTKFFYGIFMEDFGVPFWLVGLKFNKKKKITLGKGSLGR